MHGRELHEVHVPRDIRHNSLLRFPNLIADDFATTPLGYASNKLAPPFDVSVVRRKAAERKQDLQIAILVQTEQVLEAFKRGLSPVFCEGCRIDQQPDDCRHRAGQVGRERLGIESLVDRDAAQLGVRGQHTRRHQDHDRRQGGRQTQTPVHMEAWDNPSTSPIGANEVPRITRSNRPRNPSRQK